jgi:DNA-binding transcriptional regulator YhcF (GntR family)
MNPVVLDPDSSVAPYEQIRAQIASGIKGGVLQPAVRLPTVRGLAAQLGVAVNTVARSYRQLELEGLVTTRGHHGTFVAAETPVARHQAVVEARAFTVRMGELGIGEAEMLAILRGLWADHRGDAEHTGAGLPSPDDSGLEPPPA